MTQNHIPSVIAKIKRGVLERLRADLWFQEYFKSQPEYKKKHEKEKEEGMIKEAVRLIGKNDPSPKKGFTSWIIESYLDGGIKSLEDLGRVNQALEVFQEWRKSNKDKRLKKAEINRYCGITGCRQDRPSKERRVAPYTMLMTGSACHPTNREGETVSLTDSDGNLLDGLCEWSLEDFIETVTPKSHLDFSNHEGFQGDIVYRGATADLVRLSSEMSAKYWGKSTRWCTAADSQNMFDYYNNQGPLYVIADRAKGKDRYQLHPATRQFMNIQDDPVKLGYLANRYPDLVLEGKGRYGPKWNPSLITGSRYRLRLGLDNLVILETKYSFPKHYSDDTNNFSLARSDVKRDEYDEEPNGLYWNEGLDLQWVKALKFRWDFNRPIEGLDLKGVESLTFDYYSQFNQPIERLDLKGVTSLTFDYNSQFNQPIERLDLKGVTSLTFGWCFNQPVEGLDLKEVQSLKFGRQFNQKVKGLDLKEVQTLTFASHFNQKVEGLDLKEVQTLTFGSHFNQKVEGLDLKGVTTLEFGKHFNQPIERLDLKGVKSLEFRSNYNIEGFDLKGVTSLTLGVDFNQKVEGLDLKGVTSLTLGVDFNQKVEGLDLKGVQTLTFERSFNQPIEGLDLKGVQTLTFGNLFNQKVEGLDLKGVQTLTFGHSFNQKVEGLDLKGVETLSFGSSFDQPIKRLNLKVVKTLTFYGNIPVEGLDLKGVKTLTFDDNIPVEGLDLKGVKTLTFGWDFDRPVEGLDLKDLSLLTAPKETVIEIINKKNIRDLEIVYYEDESDEDELL